MAGSVEEELATLKERCLGQCRIINNVGDFAHVVNIQAEEVDLHMKFQLTASYPTEAPSILLRSERLSEENNDLLLCHMTSTANGMVGKAMIDALVKAALKWLEDNKVALPIKLTDTKTKRGKNVKSKKGKQFQDKIEVRKLSMKTAIDVISRIQWDEKVNKEDFLVGYMDRYRGLLEKYFNAFSWEDIASVDYTVLAIPKHRIQYFKYKDLIVWDKRIRLDNVFGSTGSKKTIIDIIDNYEREKQEKDDISEKVLGADSGKRDDYDESMSDDDDDSDSDDDIDVVIGQNTNHDRMLFGPNFAHKDENKQLESDDDVDPFWDDKLRPNYFLAVRITDPKVLENVEEVHDFMLDNEPRFTPCAIPVGSVHITLCTIRIDTPENLADAVQVLKNGADELKGILAKDKPLEIKGVDNFFNRVVYAKVKYGPEFIELVNHLKLILKEGGFDNRDNYAFVPHMTLMKVSRPVARIKQCKKVDPWLYMDYSDLRFGKQVVDRIHLCQMGDQRQEDGFYITPVSFDI